MPDKTIKAANIRRGGGVQLSTDATTQDRNVAVVPPRKDWINKGAQWRPAHHRALKMLAAARGQEFREVLEMAIAEYLAQHQDEAQP